jgi:tetratricopeptide (TPR) repeat protein/O-antigen ligase
VNQAWGSPLRNRDNHWWQSSEWLVGVGIALLPWCFGGAPMWSLGLLTFVSFAGCSLWVIGALKNETSWALPTAALVPLLLAFFGLVQLIPLPDRLLQLVSSQAFELKEFCLVPLGLLEPQPISLDAPSTARSVARMLVLFVLCITCSQLGKRPRARERLAQCISVTGALLALCGLGHWLFDEPLFFGVHKFVADLSFVTSFGNTNHLAAFLSLAALLAVGLTLASNSPRENAIWSAVAALNATGIFFTISRGGIGSFLLGVATLLWWAYQSKGLSAVNLKVSLAGVGAAIVVASLFVWERISTRVESIASLEKLRSSKLDLWPEFWNAATQYWFSGMGLGTFELGFMRFQKSQFDVTFTHPENLFLQSISEIGFIGTAALLLVALSAIWAVRATKTPLEQAFVVGVAAVFAHDVFDFSLELNAVAPAVASCAGMAIGTIKLKAPKIVRARHLLALLPVAALSGVAFAYGFPTHQHVEQALLETSIDANAQPKTVSAIGRHPSDYVLYEMLANDAVNRKEWGSVLAAVNRVLYVRPHDIDSHIIAARALAKLGRAKQALSELKLAWQLGDTSTLEWGLRIAAFEKDYRAVLLPSTAHLNAQFSLLNSGGKMQEAALLLQAAQNEIEFSMLRAEAQWLESRFVLGGEPALQKLNTLPQVFFERSDVQQHKITLLTQLGHLPEALDFAQALSRKNPANVALGLATVQLYEQMNNVAAAQETTHRLRAFANTDALKTSLFETEARLFSKEGKWQSAVDSLQTAARISPGRADLQYALADTYEKMGSIAAALESIRKGQLLDPQSNLQQPRIDRLKKLLTDR